MNPTDTAPQNPQDRLALSRACLRQAMRTPPSQPTGAAGQAHAGQAPSWLESLRSEPATRVLLDAISAWWAQHPLQTATSVAANSAKAVLNPLVQRNPWGVVLAALVVGGVLVWVRPWRWISPSVLFAGLLPQVLSKIAAQVQPQSWVDMLNAVLQQGQKPKE